MSTADWAARYVEHLGLALAPLHGKAPYCEGWNLDAKLIRTPAAARAHWTQHPHDNIGACLEPSGLVSIDADHPDGARQVLAAEGIDLDALIATTPTIIGRAPRLEFRAPETESGEIPHFRLSRKSVVWPPRAEGEKPITVLEFRAGRVQDVLPPSIHPDTHQPYCWLTPPTGAEFPQLTDALLHLWQDFDAFKHRARNLCPWADPEPERVRPSPLQRLGVTRPHNGPSVIAEFNAACDATTILASHGYVQAGKRRWKSPHGHGIAGVVVLPSGKVYCHHASDPLGDERAHDAFDLYAMFEHRGDVRAAVRAAAELLRMTQGRRTA
jgi:putative DNA primase/helicase